MASELFSMQHLRDTTRLGCEPAPSRRWLPHLQQLYIQLQRLRQQDRRPGYPHGRPSLLRELLSVSELQAEDREPQIRENFTRHILHELS